MSFTIYSLSEFATMLEAEAIRAEKEGRPSIDVQLSPKSAKEVAKILRSVARDQNTP